MWIIMVSLSGVPDKDTQKSGKCCCDNAKVELYLDFLNTSIMA